MTSPPGGRPCTCTYIESAGDRFRVSSPKKCPKHYEDAEIIDLVDDLILIAATIQDRKEDS